MTQQPAEIQVKDIDPEGIVAGIIDQMGWVDAINELAGVHSLEQVSTGQVLKAMILNGLGFVAAPLYLFSQFFEGKATEQMLGEVVKPEYLNDDRLGRALDKLYALGVTQVFTNLAMKGAQQFGILTGQTHLNLFDKNMKFCVAGKVGKLVENSNIFSGETEKILVLN